MYISEVCISNYKGFNGTKTVKFSEGINVLIGHNNAGKTTVIQALRLIFDGNTNKSLHVEDFNKKQKIKELKENPPEVIIKAKIEESENEEEYSDDLVTVSTWLNKIEKPYEATIAYKFYLPEMEHELYKKRMSTLEESNKNEYWNILEYDFLRKYKWKLYVGNIEYENTVDTETLKKFDFQFVDAIRDVQRDLFTGKNALLKEVIDFFMDYDIKTDSQMELDEKQKKILELKLEFSNKSDELIKSLQSRMETGKDEMLKYVKDTGAADGNNKPGFDGKILDTELYSALKLIVEDKTGIKLPVTQNGLGYNNLIYISLLLSKMQKNSSGDYLGTNAKVYSILAIEEPEAHLHPNMQYKFLKFLNKNKRKEVRQIFITSHSSNITAAVDIDDIIILGTDDNNEVSVAYPGKVFIKGNIEDNKSKDYVKRFIDVTKADMFFAKKIIFVEGIAEQLLIPEFAALMGHDLIDEHVSIINVGGRYFKHFLKIFDKDKNKNAIDKKVVCITDLDPTKKKKELEDKKSKIDDDEDNSNKACIPLFLDCDKEHYDYNECSNKLVGEYSDRSNIKICSQKPGISCTFEYDIVLSNPTFSDLVTHSVSNRDEIKNMMAGLNNGTEVEKIIQMIRRESKFNNDLNQYFKDGKLKFSGEDLIKQIIAARYLKSIKKGEVAQELVEVVSKETAQKATKMKVPSYISEAIKWICQ